MSPRESTVAQGLEKIITLPVLPEFDRGYQACAKRLLNAMRPTDSGSAENSDVLHSRINAIREAFDSLDDDDDSPAEVRQSAEFVIHGKSIKV